MLNFKDKYCQELVNKIVQAGYVVQPSAANYKKYNEVEIQKIIDAFEASPKSLTPRQFYYLIAISGLDVSLNAALESLRVTSIEDYAYCKAQLDGAKVFYWKDSLELYSKLKPMIIDINPESDFTEAELKILWETSSKF